MPLGGLVGEVLDGHDEESGLDLGIKANFVVHACNPSTHEAQWEDLAFEASLGYVVRIYTKKHK